MQKRPTKKEQETINTIIDLAKCNKLKCGKQVDEFMEVTFKNVVPKMTKALGARDEKKILELCRKSNASKEKKELTECSLSKCTSEYTKYAANEAKSVKIHPPPKKITTEYIKQIDDAKCVTSSRKIVERLKKQPKK